jgi:polysaccharide export outer membrane protein
MIGLGCQQFVRYRDGLHTAWVAFVMAHTWETLFQRNVINDDINKGQTEFRATMATYLQISDSKTVTSRQPSRLGSLALVCIGALTCSLLAFQMQAQTTPGDPPLSVGNQSLGNSAATRVVLPAESLGSNDLIEITVPYCPELSHNFRIGSNGQLSLPLLKKQIKAAGLTPSEAADSIKNELIAEQVMPDPVVNVSVLEYRSRSVSVLGAVVHPLTFQATGEMTLLDAIAMAGGFVPAGATDVLVSSRHVKDSGTLEVSVKTIPVNQLLLHADPAANILLQGGEEIRVTEAGKVFVVGNVVKPGSYVMQGDGDTTVLKAIALSSGLAAYSAHDAFIYRRNAAGGNRQEIKVPLNRIIQRKDPDVLLANDDILFVPDNNGKRISVKVLSQIVGFGSTAAAGMLIYK